VEFRLQDYRLIKENFDRIVSVGMFEHVGVGHYREYFDRVTNLLTHDGAALIHTIGRLDGPGSTNPWIAKYIFPGGYIPALSEMSGVVERTGLFMTDVEILRLHYAETLREWRPHVGVLSRGIGNIVPERRHGGFPDAACEEDRCAAADARLHAGRGAQAQRRRAIATTSSRGRLKKKRHRPQRPVPL
jgi:hypothetical protein